ncbi:MULTISPECIES: EutP/PduV family microcompartment system protein [Fusobacterium]|uniref:EutP/PduV family microcompartment system protein n=1 Tax=Fusobacterium TaxID=848 RepID=UPI0027DCADBD|nr:EutP/PduV family microcompartment system protein [uncultured Fusobacterium sp.]
MKMMLVGKTGSGKTTLAQRINGVDINYKKTQMISFEENIIDTPGEYIENKYYYKALTVTASNADIIAFVQSALDEDTLFPPKFSTMFAGKIIIGIITKKDLQFDSSNAENFLKCAGAEEIYYIGLNDKNEIMRLKERLGIGDESKNSNS